MRQGLLVLGLLALGLDERMRVRSVPLSYAEIWRRLDLPPKGGLLVRAHIYLWVSVCLSSLLLLRKSYVPGILEQQQLLEPVL